MAAKNPVHEYAKAPFPWFGGKSRAAPAVWEALGDVVNYVEPFAGSLATLLLRPTDHDSKRVETINDLDCFVANFWRAIQSDPESVAHHANWPVNEADLSARHIWLVNNKAELALKIRGTPDFFDPKVAGWWVWGQCSWIGSGWCTGQGPWNVDGEGRIVRQKAAIGVKSQRPHLTNDGQGVHKPTMRVGVNSKRPHLGDDGQGVHRPPWCEVGAASITEWFEWLAERLRYVRVCCGDWSRVVTPSVAHRTLATQRGKLPCGVFLDPPYSTNVRAKDLYAEDSGDVAAEVLRYCIEHTEVPNLRIVLAGYDNERHREELLPLGWREVEWFKGGRLTGGMGNARKSEGSHQQKRERLWLSPQCL